MPYADDFVWQRGTSHFGASLQALADLGEEKGYRLVSARLSGVNSFFVRKDLAGAFERFSVAELYRPLTLGLIPPAHKNWPSATEKRGCA